MPNWAGKWAGGRYYLDAQGRKVFFIERRKRSVKLTTHDETLANGALELFLQDPVAFCRPPPEPEGTPEAVHITQDRLTLYMESIADRVKDYRKAKRTDLFAWAEYLDDAGRPLDLRTVDKRTLRIALSSFRGSSKDKRRTGGFKRRAESLNCFANFLVREGELPAWSQLAVLPSQRPAQTRAERVAYSADEVHAAWLRLTDQAMKDVLQLRVAAGLHHTEISQLVGARLYTGPLPDRGTGIRVEMDKPHEIKGVLQIRQKTKPRHRASVDESSLQAALRLREGVPSRFDVYHVFSEVGMVPSNLRHTYTTLRGRGRLVHYDEGGVSLDEIAELLGHRVGSKMTGNRYDKLQVPPMMKIPLNWDVL